MGIKYDVNSKFFSKWGFEMAYILGFFYADGSMENSEYLRGKYVRFTSTDKEILEKIRDVMGSKHNFYKILNDGFFKRKDRYLLRIGDKTLYNDLEKIGLCPCKSLVVRLPYIPIKYVGDFLRGYFDGDGCVFLELHKKEEKTTIKKLSVIFTCGSRKFLVQLEELLCYTCQITKKSVYNSHRSYQLRYNTRDTIKLFCLMYKNVQNNLFLGRKFKIFEGYFKRKTEIKERRVREILKKYGHMVK